MASETASFGTSGLYDLGYYSNYTTQQCLALENPDSEVLCISQRLNITDPPSIYGFYNFTSVWQPTFCYLYNVTLHFRVNDPANFNFCTVPLRASDAFLFVSLALIATTFLFGKLSTVWVLISGGILGILNFYVNLLQIGNAVSIWLDIKPADLFFYAFLPPLIVEQAIRIEFFMFKRIAFHSIMLAFVMVVLTAMILTPIVLFAFGFSSTWSWVQGALFAAIIAPTDALAVSSVLKKSNGPAMLTAIMEGESLLNDAAGITLFEVFNKVLEQNTTIVPTVWSVIPTIIVDILKLSGIGLGIGLFAGIVSGPVLRWMRWRGAGTHIEATYVLAMAYLVYYVTNSPAGGSGVIAVVAFGLYGNATSLWGMLGSAAESGSFDAVWDMISFAANGLVFFWSGVASFNFIIRSIKLIPKNTMAYVSILLIYLFMLLIRTFCVGLFNPLFHLAGRGLTAAEILFIGWSGLRGAVSLIMVSSLSTGTRVGIKSEEANVNSDIALWTAFFVIFTLTINGPCIAPLLKVLGLNSISDSSRKIQEKSKVALLKHIEDTIKKLQNEDDDELLHGADWDSVSKYVCIREDLKDYGEFKEDSKKPFVRVKSSFNPHSYSSVLIRVFLAFLSWMEDMIRLMPRLFSLRRWRKRPDSETTDNSNIGRKSPTKSEYLESSTNDSQDDSTVNNDEQEGTAYHFECLFQSQSSLDLRRTYSKEQIQNNKDIETGDNVSTENKHELEGKPAHEAESMLTRQHTMPDDDEQVCLTGATGKSLQQELRKALRTKSLIDTKKHTKQTESPTFQQEGPTDDDSFYCSMPTNAGRAMQQELRAEIDKMKTLEEGVSADFSPQQRKDSFVHPKSPDTNQHPGDLKSLFVVEDSMESISEDVNRKFNQPSKRNMTDQEIEKTGESSCKQEMFAEGGAESSPETLTKEVVKPVHQRAVSLGELPHHNTVSAFQGALLRKELSSQRLKANIPRKKYRDLLGRTSSSYLDSIEPNIDSGLPTARLKRESGIVSHKIMARSHIHRLRGVESPSAKSSPLSSVKELVFNDEDGDTIDSPEVLPTNGLEHTASDNITPSRKKEHSKKEGKEDEVNILSEIRYRLVGGLKRYFSKRRMEGKISVEAFRILEFACDEALESRGKDLCIWETIKKSTSDSVDVRLMARISFKLMKFYKSLPTWLKTGSAFFFKSTSIIFRKLLAQKVLLACEVAVEYNMALSISSHVKWLKLHGENFWILLDEVEKEIERSHDFITDREIEAPDTFRAIQSYRAAMAVLKRVLSFIEELLTVGVVDENEAAQLEAPVTRKMRRLEIVGPVYRIAAPRSIVRSLRPFSFVSSPVFSWVWNCGLLHECIPGQLIYRVTDSGEREASVDGIFYVLVGVVKKIRDGTGSTREETFCGSGSCFGVLASLGFPCLKGSEDVLSVGNSLDRGPILFRLTCEDLDKIKKGAQEGDLEMKKLIDGWTIIGALHVLEELEKHVVSKIEIDIKIILAQEEKVNLASAANKMSRPFYGNEIPRSPFVSPEANSTRDIENEEKHTKITSKVTLEQVFSEDIVSLPSEGTLSMANASAAIHQRAKLAARDIYHRIKRFIYLSSIVEIPKSTIFEQKSTIILLRGSLELIEGVEERLLGDHISQNMMNAPSVMPWLLSSDEAFIFERHSHETRSSVLEPRKWKVNSEDAILVALPESSSVEEGTD